ncbi:uncharacterized protein LOC114469421 [Gouania willdenowi]|uniref:Serine-rich adhesin for platelets-like n=1 Tax=Gouania willdenowi TaxID=441366 RepID=A0A8C5DYC8_GOUWI|nr:uncharacterized protein LOC114469421 [Gouania willdenowi]XP_028312732.1 uncharacterized protein LOC114469421 [Gouania willdenowi]XP_028312733.1 uncharacterized protein LOC114469421 [Gouania willdenowi]
MVLSLYECLKVVGLQRHHDRLSSAGVCHVVHLSALTTEDCSLLGISSVEDRSRLFELIQVLKSLEFESPGYEEDYSHSASTSDRGYTVMGKDHGKLRKDISDDDDDGDDDDDEETDSYAGLLSVSSRHQFSNESPHLPQMQIPNLTDSVDVYSSDNRTNPALGKEPAIPVQVYPVCSCRGNNTCSNCSPHHHRRENVYPCVARGNYFCNYSNNELSSIPVLNPRTRVSPKTKDLNFGQKDKKKVFRKKNIYKETDDIKSVRLLSKPTPIYEAKRLAPNNRQPGMQRIYVCVRKRPLTQAERRRRDTDVVTTPGGECLIVHENKEAVDLTHYILQHKFHFDSVFGDESSNEDVYKRTTYPLVQHMLNGGKATCFAYGQTGAGKTHTMLGSCPTRPGLYALAVQDIFKHLSTTHTCSSQQMYVSFFEIYCGQLYDLLDHRKRLFAREDGQKVVHISGLRYIKVTSIESLMEVISQGTEERTQGVSGVNPFSSRSHAVLQIELRHSTQQRAGRMWFVDLAGSERASDSKDPNKQSRKEGAEINQSLLALKECIRSLDRKQKHTPFRQSKLTQVLKDSFVGDSMTCMIANISPGNSATEHTLNTLRYADRVKELKGQRGKTVSSSKQSSSNSNTSSSNSSVGTRRKSPSKKQKLAGESRSFGPRSSQTEDAILCSTPKNSSCGSDGATLGRKWIELEHNTPIRGWQGMSKESQWSKKAGERKGRIIQTEKEQCHYVSKQRIATDLMALQKDEQLELWEMERNSLLLDSCMTSNEGEYEHKTRLKHGGNGGNTKDRKWVELRRQIENHGETRGETEMLEESYFQKEKEVNKEEQHLMKYHQQLQQFRPSSTSSSLNLCSNSFSISPSSTIVHSSSSSSSSLEDVLDSDSARAENRNKGKPLSSRETIPQHAVISRNSDEETQGDLSRIYRVGRDETGGRVEFDSSDSERSDKVTGAARVRKEDNTPAGMEIQGRRRAWVATQGTNTMTAAISTNVATSYVLCNGDLESRVEASSVPSAKVWKQRAADDSKLDSADCSSHFSLSDFKSPAQKAPAERPLSPTPTNASLITMWKSDTDRLYVQKSLEAAPSNSQRVNKALSTANAHAATLPLGCKAPVEPIWLKHPVYYQKRDVLPEDDDTESQSYTMEPLSISLLQADQQVATVSFLQGSNCDNSTYLLDKESSENHDSEIGKKINSDMSLEEEDGEFHISLLETPQSKSHHTTVSSSMTVSTNSDTSTDNRIRGNKAPEDLQSCPQDQKKSLENPPQTYSKLPLKCCYRQNTVSLRSFMTNLHHKNQSIQLQPNSHVAANDNPSPCNQNDLDQAWWSISVAQREQLKQMETLSHEEGKLLSQQPNMAFEEYVNRLGKIVEAKVLCVNNLRAQLLPFLKPIKSSMRK